MLKPTAIATAISGTLDILFAMVLTLWFGREIPNMLRYVASGPFPAATDMGAVGVILGLLVHFTLMAIMAAALMIYLRRKPDHLRRPMAVGVAYGLLTYFVMNWLVNYYMEEVGGRTNSLIAFSRENTLTCVFYLIGLITMYRSSKHERFAALSVLLLLMTVILFNNLWRQYFLLTMPLIAIVASYAIYSSFSSRLIRFVVLIGAIYFP